MSRGMGMIASFLGGAAQRGLDERDRKNKIKDAVELQKQLSPITLEMYEKQQQIEFPYKQRIKAMDIAADLQKYQYKEEQKNNNKESITVSAYPQFNIGKIYKGTVLGPDAGSRAISRSGHFSAAYKNFAKGIKDGTTTYEEVTKALKNNGDYAKLKNWAIDTYTNKNLEAQKANNNNKVRLAPTVVFPTLAPLVAPIIAEVQTANLSPELKAIDSTFKQLNGFSISNSIHNVIPDAAFGGFKKEVTAGMINKDFFNLNQRYLNREAGLDHDKFLAQSQKILGLGSKSKKETKDIINMITSYSQKRLSYGGDGSLLPSGYELVDPKANATQLQKMQKNLSSALDDTAGLLIKGNPNVSEFSSNVSQFFGTLGAGLTEVSKTYLGIDPFAAAKKNLHSEFATKIEQEMNVTQLDSGTKEIVTDLITNSNKQIDSIVKELKQKDLPDNRRKILEDTYKYHMQKLYLTFAFSKYIQGGAGGNAVSNADFANTAKALFGTFSTNSKENRMIIAGGLADLHFNLQEDLSNSVLNNNFKAAVDGKGMRVISSATARRLSADKLSILREAKELGPIAYWSAVSGNQFKDPRGPANVVTSSPLSTRKKAIESNNTTTPKERDKAPFPGGEEESPPPEGEVSPPSEGEEVNNMSSPLDINTSPPVVNNSEEPLKTFRVGS
tara:strand:- start:4461 stop:6473 length:2013 start_codon:yes stop_codon:yes gene_type:complete